MKKNKSDTFPLQLDLFTPELLTPLTQESGNEPVLHQKENKAPSKNRFIEFNSIKIEYELRRSKRRSIGFLINEKGLRVTAPQWVTIKSIEEAIRTKSHWITQKLDYFRSLPQKQNTPAKLESGITLSYFGTPLLLQLQHGLIENITFDESEKKLIVTTTDLSQDAIKTALKKWFQEKAKDFFFQRLSFFADKLDVQYKAFSISSAKYRWGSCSISGNIRLNWKLIHFPPQLIDYVIVHELSHLREMNHSNRFWHIVSQIFPNYKTLRQELNRQSLQIPFLL